MFEKTLKDLQTHTWCLKSFIEDEDWYYAKMSLENCFEVLHRIEERMTHAAALPQLTKPQAE